MLDSAVAVRRHDQRMGAGAGENQREAAIFAGECAERRADDQDFRLRDGTAQFRVHDNAAEGSTLLGSRGVGRDNSGQPQKRSADPPAASHGYWRRHTVVEAESAGCSTTTVKVELSKV